MVLVFVSAVDAISKVLPDRRLELLQNLINAVLLGLGLENTPSLRMVWTNDNVGLTVTI
jgi:hypothetical protein